MNSVQGVPPIEYPASYSNARPLSRSDFDWRSGFHALSALALRSLWLFLIIDGFIHYRDLAAFVAHTMQWYFLQDGIAQLLLGTGVACWLTALGFWVNVLRLAPHHRHRLLRQHRNH
jgi:hypothetical protein